MISLRREMNAWDVKVLVFSWEQFFERWLDTLQLKQVIDILDHSDSKTKKVASRTKLVIKTEADVNEEIKRFFEAAIDLTVHCSSRSW